MDCQHLSEVYEIYLLGGLAGGESEELESHVREACPRCLQALREAAETLFWLVQNSHPARPRPAVKSRLSERISTASIRPAGVRKPRLPAHPAARPGR